MAVSAEDAAVRAAILGKVPEKGIGRQALLAALESSIGGVTEEDYRRVCEAMIAEGLLAEGRGGSVYRSGAEGSAAEAAAAAGGKDAAYRHGGEAVQRPAVGVEAQFAQRKPPRSYRYDSSLAPELAWDESGERALAEWLLTLIAEAAERGEAAVFAAPQVWQGSGETFTSLSQCAARLRSLTRPFLNWAGKAERWQVTVPALPLFVHERHSTQAILKTLKAHRARGTRLDLFGDLFGDAGLDIADQLEAYRHKGPWTNRLILGDSLQAMHSLLDYEGMGGQVQMLYFDPPYGVKFGSNFQPFVRDRRVSNNHGNDTYMSREPEMVKAYRDTWELGIHSYLTYLRDRLMLARELLTETGSVFVQISDDNVHIVRNVLDEVFGRENFVSQISFKKTGGFSGKYISSNHDLILWYGKHKELLKYHPIYISCPEPEPDDPNYVWLEFRDGEIRRMSPKERRREVPLPEDARVFRYGPLTSDGASKESQPFEFDGQTFYPGANGHWKTTLDGMGILASKEMLIRSGSKGLAWKMYWDNFPAKAIDNVWSDTQSGGFNEAKIYVVQTTTKTISRCMHMTTQPGDLVLDITCGSGTSAVVAEHWGRRWIAVDTSRVPIALARQRLLTSSFPWYQLKEPVKGPAGGFVYERKQNSKGEEIGGLVPRITLKSIANDEDPKIETLPERAEVNPKITRVCGPFTVEATVQAAVNLEELSQPERAPAPAENPRAYLDRMIELLRRCKRLRLPGNVTLGLDNIRPLADREYLHAEGVAGNGGAETAAIAFGPEEGAIGSEFVFNAAIEAMSQGFQQLFLFGFAIQAKARAMLETLKIPATYVAVAPDVVMSDLLKTNGGSEIFSITGLPDVTLEKAGRANDGGRQYRVSIKGLDIFRPDRMETEAIGGEQLPCWMLDSDYDGMTFYAVQVFFPKTGAWDNLQRSLKGQFEESVWQHLAGTVSAPFRLGPRRRIAVKAIDERGNELMAVRSEDEAV